MIPQIGFAEMIVLALLAIIVVGPKDLPKLMRNVGAFMGKMRALGNEFKQAFEEMSAEDEIAEMRREIEALKNLGSFEHLDDGDIASEMRALDDDIRDVTETPLDDSRLADSIPDEMLSNPKVNEPKKPPAKKAAPNKATVKKPTPKKTSPKKTVAKKAVAKKTPKKGKA